MKTLTLSVLLCVIMALTTAAALSGEKDEAGSVTVNDGGEQHVVKRSQRCPRNWFKYRGRCFVYVSRRRTWAEAERYCVHLGANLASVHSRREYNWLRWMITYVSHSYPETWIGGSDGEQERMWFWSDGTPFNFRFWCLRQPDNVFGRQNCLQMNHSAYKCWDDDFCRHVKPSVCARKF